MYFHAYCIVLQYESSIILYIFMFMYEPKFRNS